jgi:hypothetical protein
VFYSATGFFRFISQGLTSDGIPFSKFELLDELGNQIEITAYGHINDSLENGDGDDRCIVTVSGAVLTAGVLRLDPDNCPAALWKIIDPEHCSVLRQWWEAKGNTLYPHVMNGCVRETDVTHSPGDTYSYTSSEQQALEDFTFSKTIG